jgi:hypothetical protein
MTAMTTERNTIRRLGDTRVEPLAAAIKVWAGSLVMRNAAGFVTKGATATGGIGIGRAEATADNSGGTAGAMTVEYRRGVYGFANAAGADLIAQADIGTLCYIVDDQTVAKTDGSATRSPVGIIDGVEGFTVWVLLDEAVTRGAL